MMLPCIVQVARAKAVAASITSGAGATSASGGSGSSSKVDAAMAKLNMDKYDEEDDNLISQILQVPLVSVQMHVAQSPAQDH